MRPALSYANVMATVAVFVALGGGAYALGGKNSVKSDDIKDGQVKSKDLKNDDVRSGDIENSAVGVGELAANSVQGGEVADGSLTGADIDESKLTGLPAPDDATEMAAEQDMALFTSDTAFDFGDGSIVYQCAAAPALTYANDSGADALVVSSRRSLVFEDDGVAGNGELGSREARYRTAARTTCQLPERAASAGPRWRSTDDELIYVELYSRVVTGCDYVAIMHREPR